MKLTARTALVLASLASLVGGFGGCALNPPAEALSAVEVDPDPSAIWIADPRDNVCGLAEPRHLTSPARVNFARALEATPAMREMREKAIHPASARGRILYARAEDELCRAAKEVRESSEHCSVWKRIRHRDGRSVPDRTDDVEAVLSVGG